MPKAFNTAIIDAGPAGVPAALFLLSKGKSVCLFERSGHLGGTCLFEGCILPGYSLRAQKIFVFREDGSFW